MRRNIPYRRGRAALAVVCFLENLESRLLLAGATPVFEADFNGSGGGTGGSGNIVLTGGTGTLGTSAGVTNTVIATTATASAADAVALNPDGSLLYVTEAFGTVVWVYSV